MVYVLGVRKNIIIKEHRLENLTYLNSELESIQSENSKQYTTMNKSNDLNESLITQEVKNDILANTTDKEKYTITSYNDEILIRKRVK